MSDACRLIEEQFVEVGREALFEDPEARAHIETCEQCAAAFAAMEEVDAMLPELPVVDTPSSSLDLTPASAGEVAAGATAAESSAAAEWHVAIADEQIGPMTLSAVEEQWHAGAIDAESVVWKQGMPDWLPLAEVPELGHLVAAQVAAVAAPGLSDLNGQPTANGPVLYGNQSPDGEPIQWKPSAGSDLASLVDEELVADEPSPAVAAAAAAAVVPDGLPSGPGFGLGAGGFDFAGTGEAPPTLEAPAPQGWSVPAPPPAPSRAVMKPIHWILTAVGSTGALAAVAAAVVILVPNRPVDQPALPPMGAPGATRPVAAAPGAIPHVAAPAPTTPGPVAAAESVSASAPASAAPAPAVESRRGAKSSGARGGGRSGGKAGGKSGGRSSGKSGGKSGGVAAGAAMDDVFKKDVKEKLSIQDIVGGVKKNAGSVMGCLKSARAKGEIVPGTYKLILGWDIKPNGSVANTRMVGPSKVMGTSLPSCFARSMRKWKFPPSQKGAPVKNFPFGPFTVK